MSSTTTTKEIALTFFNTVNADDMDAFRAILADDFTHGYLPASVGSPVKTREAYLTMVDGWRADPNLKSFRFMAPLDVIVGEDAVVVHIECVGTKKDGKEHKHEFIIIFKIKDGKIASAREFVDTKAMGGGDC